MLRVTSLATTVRRYTEALRFQSVTQMQSRLRLEAAFGLYRLVPFLGLPAAVEWACDIRAGKLQVNEHFRRAPTGVEEQGGYLGGNRFCFLNEEADLGDPTDWAGEGKSLLWRFHLNYFDWAPRLASEGRLDELERQIAGWIASNPAGRQPAWHPYPTSLRIVNWIRALKLLGTPSTCSHWIHSLRRQAAFLESHLEFHLGGNHLIENAFSLLVAGLFFDGDAARRWAREGLLLLTDELDKQVLPDGGHVERSLSYHFRVNLVCREAICLLAANGRDVPAKLHAVHERMSAFTEGVRHADGNVPLFHDSQLIEESTWKHFQRLIRPAPTSV